MQKALIGMLTVTTLGLAVLCGVQFQQLRAAREQTRAAEEARAADTEDRQAQATRVKDLERVNRRLEQQVEKFAAVTTMLRTNEARQSSNLTAMAESLRSLRGGNSDTAEEGEGAFGKGMGEMLGKMMKDPAMREMMREQQKAMINMMYSGLYKELNLTPEEKDQFRTLLTEAQMKTIENAQSLFGTNQAASADMTRQIQAAKKESDAAIKALLGDQRFAQYDDYRNNINERMQLDQFKNQLATDNVPLRDEQSAQLLQILKEEKLALPPAISTEESQIPSKETFTAEKLDQQLKWMDEYNKRVLDRAGQVLTPEQLTQYKSFQEQQASMQKLGLQMAKQMFGAEKGSKPTAVPAFK